MGVAEGGGILTVFEVRNGLEGQTVGIQRSWSTDFPGRVPARKQVEFGVNEDPRCHRIAQSATKSGWREHWEETLNLSAGAWSVRFDWPTLWIKFVGTDALSPERDGPLSVSAGGSGVGLG